MFSQFHGFFQDTTGVESKKRCQDTKTHMYYDLDQVLATSLRIGTSVSTETAPPAKAEGGSSFQRAASTSLSQQDNMS